MYRVYQQIFFPLVHTWSIDSYSVQNRFWLNLLFRKAISELDYLWIYKWIWTNTHICKSKEYHLSNKTCIQIKGEKFFEYYKLFNSFYWLKCLIFLHMLTLTCMAKKTSNFEKNAIFDYQINEATKSNSQLRCHLNLWRVNKFSEIIRCRRAYTINDIYLD